MPLNNPVGDAEVITQDTWTTLHNAVVIGATATADSAAIDVTGWSGVWVKADIDSTLAPTDIRILAQFSIDGGINWSDFVEGLWASLYWEDTDTAAGISVIFLLPCGGVDTIRIRLIGTGTNAGNFFTVTVDARAFRGNLTGAHS